MLMPVIGKERISDTFDCMPFFLFVWYFLWGWKETSLLFVLGATLLPFPSGRVQGVGAHCGEERGGRVGPTGAGPDALWRTQAISRMLLKCTEGPSSLRSPAQPSLPGRGRHACAVAHHPGLGGLWRGSRWVPAPADYPALGRGKGGEGLKAAARTLEAGQGRAWGRRQ